MRALWQIIRVLWNAAPAAMIRGVLLAICVLWMGAALLGLSGWFITATGLAGLAGVGIAFDVFRPSAGVRFLALGRTAARYGERLLTHDATLRALAALRVVLLRRQERLSGAALVRLRSEGVLTRIIADVDALDGAMLRLVVPVLSAWVTYVLAALALWVLVGPLVAIAVFAALPLGAIVLIWLAWRGVRLSDQQEQATQTLRRNVIDALRDRQALILAGRLATAQSQLLSQDAHVRQLATRQDRLERRAGAVLAALVALSAAGALLAGGWMLGQGGAGPAQAVIGFFVALALAEAILPLRRGFAELGRMCGAAERIAPEGPRVATPGAQRRAGPGPCLELTKPSLSVNAGEALALSGPSGVGKTSLLLHIAGLGSGAPLRIAGHAPDDWDPDALRGYLTMLPQRSALMSGTVRDNLALAGDFDEAALWAALRSVALDGVIAARGGLDFSLDEAGQGLSGGQSRRLALARCVLRRPRLLLLDEPTEGLDADTADRVLTGLRKALPETAIVAALHRGSDHPIFTQSYHLSW